MYKLSLRNSDPGAKTKYTRYKNLLRTCIKNSESLYHRELFENTKTSAYNLWKHLGPIINNKKKTRGNLINKIPKKGATVSDTKGIANALNSYFCEIGPQLQSKFPNTAQSFMNFMPANIAENFFLQPITAHKIKLEILKLNPRKSPGDDKIGEKNISNMPWCRCRNLAKIYDNSIIKGDYPNQMKIVKVIALFKKGENSCLKTIDQLVYYQSFINFLKKLCANNLHRSLNVTKYHIITNLDSGNSILQLWLW